jgi:uncharacterized MAPEG superfamily protein
MELVILIITLALLQFIWFGLLTGRARVAYNVKAPATSGHPVFERQFRVQQNTLEQLIVFIPALVSFSWMAESIGWPGNEIAAFLGVFYLIGRALYARAYVKDPLSRSVGFLLSFFPSAVMLPGTLVCILLAVI